MASGVNMTCPGCKLQFPSMKLFLKHREKFCDKSDRNEVISQRSHIKSVSKLLYLQLHKNVSKTNFCDAVIPKKHECINSYFQFY